MTTRIGAIVASVAILSTVGGCGGSGKPPVVPAAGKVMFNKTTAPAGALVVFHPVDGALEKRIGGKPFGKVKDNGTFALTTYAQGDGAPEGEYGVTIDWRGKKEKAEGFTIGEGGGGQPLLNPKFSNPQQPAFKVIVKKGDKNDFTFDVD
jgi:hypothetical protein